MAHARHLKTLMGGKTVGRDLLLPGRIPYVVLHRRGVAFGGWSANCAEED